MHNYKEIIPDTTQKFALHDGDIEQCFLSTLLHHPNLISRAKELLPLGNFYFPEHEKVYMGMLVLAERGVQPDPILLNQYLANDEVFEGLGGVPKYMAQLIQAFYSQANLAEYAKQIREMHNRRKAQAFAQSLQVMTQSHALGEIDAFIKDGLQGLSFEKPVAFTNRLAPISALDLMNMDIAPYEYLLPPWLPKCGIVLLYAVRGVGKTMMALKLGCALSAGQGVLGYIPTRPCKVVYVDGEMPASLMQQRLREIVYKDKAVTDIQLICNDLVKEGRIDLSNPAHRAELEKAAGNFDLIILDNLSTLYGYDKENEAASWGDLQNWLMKIRKDGKCVIVVHHAGKNGSQRGTSAKEVVPDVIVSLKKCFEPNENSDHTAIEWHFEKARTFFGKDAEPFQVTFKPVAGGGLEFERSPLKANPDAERVRDMKSQGMSLRAIESETGIPKSTVERMLRAG